METILVVDDDAAVREVVRALLAAVGYNILAARNAEEALRLAERHEGPIDLLLTDIIMLGMNGAELAARFSRLRPSARVLMMTGFAPETLMRRGVVGVEYAVIRKPFSPGALPAKVREVLDG